jgi:hypothetical protein
MITLTVGECILSLYVRTKTQILHLNSNQIFFIYNQVSLHVSANVGHLQVNTIQGITIFAGHYQCVCESTQLKNTKNIKNIKLNLKHRKFKRSRRSCYESGARINVFRMHYCPTSVEHAVEIKVKMYGCTVSF